jgi:hypothetical protein
MLTEAESQRPNEAVGKIETVSPGVAVAQKRGGSSVAYAVAITAIVYGIFIAGRLGLHQWDPSYFVVAGGEFCFPPLSPKGLLVLPGLGYDGQFYYRLALDPTTNAHFRYGIELDDPPYRQQRILYPLLAYLIAFGRPEWVAWSMLLINYLAVCLLAFSAGRLAEFFGISAFFGLALPFYPGILLALARDLTDVLSISLVVTSLLLLHYRRTLFAVATVAGAVLTRETVLLLAGAIFLWSMWRLIRGRISWKETALWTIPLVVFAAWQLRIVAVWGTIPALGNPGNDPGTNISRGFPFSELLPTLSHAVQLALSFQPLLLGELLLIASITIVAAARLRNSSVEPVLKFAWLLYFLLMAMLSQRIWVEDWAFLRGTADLMALSLIVIIGAKNRRLLKEVTGFTLLIWIALAVRTVSRQ